MPKGIFSESPNQKFSKKKGASAVGLVTLGDNSLVFSLFLCYIQGLICP